MNVMNIIAILVTVSAGFAYINHRFLKLPMTIGLMISSLTFSLVIILLNLIGFDLKSDAERILNSIDFNETLMNGMLSFLLFAGAMHVDLEDLKKQKLPVAVLATFGVVLSTLLIGFMIYFIVKAFNFDLPLIYCLLFGSLISPTDPIAVLGILKTANAPKTLEIKIAGESLFNDGVGVVIFLAILGYATGTGDHSISGTINLFLVEAVGGVVFGLGIGIIAYKLLKSIDEYKTEILITLALVCGGYALATSMHTSGPLAMVVAGLFIGNRGRAFAMSNTTVDRLDDFWELIDEILNAMLFVLIGLEVLIIPFTQSNVVLGLIAIPVVLLARFVAISLPVTFLKRWRTFSPHAIKIMTWGGLRGGLSVAMALQLPHGEHRHTVLIVTYCVVVFSIIVQGLTIEKLIKRT